VLAGAALASTASAVPDQGKRASSEGTSQEHNFKHPIAQKQDALRLKALEKVLKGKARHDKVVQVAKGQYVELKREGVDKIFTIIVEFGDTQYETATDKRFLGKAADAQRVDGPLHNQIPEPDRSVDNSTLWKPDYDLAHYEDMYFNRMAQYYERQSSNRYSVEGKVHGWVKVPYNQALYGRDYCGGIVCSSTKALVRDALAVWVKQEVDSGKSLQQVADYLRTFDEWDRYDLDGDGNFDEPDGYIDHLQVVHAGGDQAAGDPLYGSDAIWSHRWFTNLQAGGPHGFIGVNVGTNGGIFSSSLVPNNATGVWVFDYTIQPENGGLGVFAHEYAHDLGLPDLYDTSGNTGGAENSTAFWTLMSSGANIGDGGPDGIGDAPTDLSAWELLQLGWLEPQDGKGPFYDVAFAGRKSEHKLGPNDAATKKAQGLFVVLPDVQTELRLVDPPTGDWAFWSTMGDDLNTTMTKTSGIAGTSLTANVWYEIEADWDYAFLEASTNGGSTWLPVATNLSDTAGDQSGFNGSKTGLTGHSNGVKQLTATLPAGTNAIRFRYQTDGAFVEPGFVVDDVTVGGTLVGGAESDAEGWAFAGFKRTTGTEVENHFNAYVAENRQYDRYDASLRTAYNFGFLNTKPDWVEHYPYQDGMLLWYWNNAYADNSVGDHPGAGLLLPIDSHPAMTYWSDGTLLRPRLLSYDSTFGLEPTDAITVHTNGMEATIASQPAVPVFDDSKAYWVDGTAPGRYQPRWNSVKVPNTGTQIRVKSVSAQGNFMQVEVSGTK
jgi:immune inhibitor A